MMLRFVLRSEQAGTAASRFAVAATAAPAAQGRHSKYSACAYGDYGREKRSSSPDSTPAENFNHVPLWIRRFLQTNPMVASALYASARDWVRALPVNHMWDLFCGVGALVYIVQRQR
jgi:23S rRNA (uracil747-C5)-methyltransferase